MAERSLFAEERPPLRLWLIPALGVVAGSAVALLPISAPIPLIPPCGLLMLLGWRLLRPELWQAWIGLPLGLADDLIGGAPLGSAMILWTIILIGLDIVDYRLVWRDRQTDWSLAAWAIAFAALGGWLLSWLAGGAGPLPTVLFPSLFGMLCYPLAARICARLDRIRLRVRRG